MANHPQVLEAVLALPYMKEKTMLHLTLVGSRSRGIAREDADYDVKAIILHSTADYLLQSVTPNRSFVTSMIDPLNGNEVKVEGTLVDYLTMQNYTLSSSVAAYETLVAGVHIYTTQATEYLEELFGKCYRPQVLITSFQGIGKSISRKASKELTSSTTGHQTIKHAANQVYYASLLKAIARNPSVPPKVLDAYALLHELQLEPKLETAIHKLYAQRKKQATDVDNISVDMEPFETFLDCSAKLVLPKPANNEQLRWLRHEANEKFLQLTSTGSSLGCVMP